MLASVCSRIAHPATRHRCQASPEELSELGSGGRVVTEAIEEVSHEVVRAEVRGSEVVEAAEREAIELAEREAVQLAERQGLRLAGREAVQLAEREAVELADGELAASAPTSALNKLVKTANRSAAPQLSHATHLSPFMQGAFTVGAIGSAVIAPFLIYSGVKSWHEDKLEATGNITLGLESAAASLAMAGEVSEQFGQVGEVAGKVLKPLALFHGGIDIAIGGRHWVEGKRVEGALEIGFGASVIGAALGGGLPCIVAAGGLLAAKVAHRVMETREHSSRAENSGGAAREPGRN